MSSRSSSVSRASSISEGPITQYQGRIFVANSTDSEWKINILKNDYEIGTNTNAEFTLGAHQVSQLPCEFIQVGTRKPPIIIRATRRKNGIVEEKPFQTPVKNKSGLIVTSNALIYSKMRWKPKFLEVLSRPFTSGTEDCWTPKFDKTMNYNPHKNLAEGEMCSICQASASITNEDVEEYPTSTFSIILQVEGISFNPFDQVSYINSLYPSIEGNNIKKDILYSQSLKLSVL